MGAGGCESSTRGREEAVASIHRVTRLRCPLSWPVQRCAPASSPSQSGAVGQKAFLFPCRFFFSLSFQRPQKNKTVILWLTGLIGSALRDTTVSTNILKTQNKNPFLKRTKISIGVVHGLSTGRFGGAAAVSRGPLVIRRTSVKVGAGGRGAAR